MSMPAHPESEAAISKVWQPYLLALGRVAHAGNSGSFRRRFAVFSFTLPA